MAESYRKLGMADLAADSEKVLKENYTNVDKLCAQGAQPSSRSLFAHEVTTQTRSSARRERTFDVGDE